MLSSSRNGQEQTKVARRIRVIWPPEMYVEQAETDSPKEPYYRLALAIIAGTT
jgi:hypothetical protein